MSNKSGGNSKTAQANNYKTLKRWESNRLKKIARHLKRFPEDKVAEKAVNNIVYRRKIPKTPQWSHTQIEIARLFKTFRGSVDRDIFHSNEKISAAALLMPGPYSKTKTQPDLNTKTMFQLGLRARFV